MPKLQLDRQFENAFDNAGIGMAFASLEGKWLKVNAALCRMLGYTEQELLEKTFVDITFLSDANDDLRARERMLRNEIQSYQREKRYVHRDGRTIWVQINVSLLKDEKNSPLNFFSQSQNITDRKDAEKALNESIETVLELNSLINQARDVIVLLDIDGRVRLWNQGAEKLYGWSSQEAVGRKNTELYAANSKTLDDEVRLLIEQGYWEGETQRITRAGHIVTVGSRATLMKDSFGMAKSILVISTDVTDLKKTIAAQLRSQRLESIGTLAGGIAHDLNNVLTPIMIGIEILARGETNATRLGLLDTMTSCSLRGAGMIRQVLSFARGIDGQRSEIQPALIVQELKKIVSDTFLKTVQLECLLSADLRTVSADSTQLQQVLLNLAVNARDAMVAGGKIILSAENVHLTEIDAAHSQCLPGPYVRITMEDDGAGMPKNILDRIFEPFFTTKEIGKGTGLGLSTSLAIVKSHNGFMTVYSEEGVGTKFCMYLPAFRQPAAESAQSDKSFLPLGAGECILIVDDEPTVRTMTAQILEAFGYRARVAAGAIEALAIYKEAPDEIAVVITDIMMPGMDGVALIRALKEINPKLRVIAASGLASHADASTANLFLTKPYRAEVILQALRSCLEG